MILNNHFGEYEAFFEESYNITMDIEKNYFYNYDGFHDGLFYDLL